MNHFKTVLAGIAGAVIAVVILCAALLGYVYWRIEPANKGLTAVIVSAGQLFLATTIGFALGCWWSVRKQRFRIRAHDR